jgi:hypothetical protein
MENNCSSQNQYVVYLMGAGASYQAIPTYIDFSDSLMSFIQVLKTIGQMASAKQTLMETEGNNYHFQKVKIELPEDYFDTLGEFIKIAQECKYYGTPDTYAASLNNNSSTNKSKLILLKKLISGFLYLLHFEVDEEYFKSLPTIIHMFRSIYHKNEIHSTTESQSYGNQLDRRYISLWASVIAKDKSEIQKLRFITWNYDIQIARSLYKFLKNIKQVDAYIKSNVIQLNGNCNLVGRSYNQERFLKDNILQEIIDYMFSKKSKSILQLKFSWEKSEVTKAAAHWMKGAKAVATIGYSFPDYNRQYDVQLFPENYNTKTYIQDYNPQNVLKKLSTISDHFHPDQNLSLNSSLTSNYELVDYTGQFILPAEFWKI